MPVVLEVLSMQQKNFYSSNTSHSPGNLISIKKQPCDPRNKTIIYMFRGRVHVFLHPSVGQCSWGGMAPVRDVAQEPPLPPTSFLQEGRHRAVCLQQINREGCFCLSDWSRTIYSSVTPRERLVDLRALLL